MKIFHCIGLMSGSSLDGVDLVYCTFCLNEGMWQYQILESDCISYPSHLVDKLKSAPRESAQLVYELDVELGQFFGESIEAFRAQKNIQELDFIASHGHTIFHFPAKNFTTQIGDGATLAAQTRQTVINQFRSVDVALGGQGAPIVPIGEKYLFHVYSLFLNIGGIVNISSHQENDIKAFDVCVANQILNYLANQKNLAYDSEGKLAAAGQINHALLLKLNAPIYFEQEHPKSLDNSFASIIHKPILDEAEISVEDKLATYCSHIAYQIASALERMECKTKSIFVTGGGAFNTYLIHEIERQTKLNVIVPSSEIVQYKEALIIAFMGLLRLQNQPNVLHSVTGAKCDSINGAIYQG